MTKLRPEEVVSSANCQSWDINKLLCVLIKNYICSSLYFYTLYGIILDSMQLLKVKFTYGEIMMDEFQQKYELFEQLEKQEINIFAKLVFSLFVLYLFSKVRSYLLKLYSCQYYLLYLLSFF